MHRHVFLVVTVLLVAQAKSGLIQPRTLADQAQQQLQELQSIVQGQISVAHNDLSDLDTEFVINGNIVVSEGTLSIEQEQATIDSQLTIIKNLAHTAGKDISSCTDIREELLNRLPSEYVDTMKGCVTAKYREVATIISDATYVVDITINKVHTLEYQFWQCNGNILCLSPLITEIQLDKIRLPQNIRSEVQVAESLLTTLKLTTATCQDTNVSGYTSDALSILLDITQCANKILG